MKLFTSLSLLAGIATLLPALSAEPIEVSTTPVGVVTFTVQAGNTTVAPLFVIGDTFQGISTSIVVNAGQSTITFANAAFTGGAFNEGAFPVYYAEVAKGTFEGFNFDIISNTASSITVSGDLVALGLTQTESIVIREHVTLGSLFEDAAGIQRRDLVKFFNPDGSSDLIQWDGTAWANGNASRPIYPGTGIITVFSQDVTVQTDGMVKPTKTVVPIYTQNNAINLIGSSSPVDVLLADLNLGGQIERRDLVKFFESGTLGTYALYSADSGGNLNLSTGTPVSDVYAGEAILISTASELSVTLPKATKD